MPLVVLLVVQDTYHPNASTRDPEEYDVRAVPRATHPTTCIVPSREMSGRFGQIEEFEVQTVDIPVHLLLTPRVQGVVSDIEDILLRSRREIDFLH